MSSLSRIPKELSSCLTSIHNPEEQQTAIEVFTKLLPTLERKLHANKDNLLIAAGLYEIRERHGYKSEAYQTVLDGLALLDESWGERNFRQSWLDAYQGYMCLPGSDQDKQVILKMNPSRSALAAIRFIPNHRVYKFFMEVKQVGVFPTAAAVEKFAKQGRLTSKTVPSGVVVKTVENTTVERTPDPDPIIDVVATPIVEKEIPLPQEMEVLESANDSTDEEINVGKIARISEPTTTTTTDPMIDELAVLYKAYETFIQQNYQKIKNKPEAMKMAKWFNDLNSSYLKIIPN